MIAALYAALTLVQTMFFPSLAFGQIQFRIAEALTILPVFTSAAIPGLFVGCIIANGAGAAVGATDPLDIVFGSLATLAAAVISWQVRKLSVKNVPVLAFIPPVALNALVVGAEIHIFFGAPLLLSMIYVGAGQTAVCATLGVLLFFAVRRAKIFEKKYNKI